MARTEPYTELFPDLKLHEFRQLCFTAYYGELYNNDKPASAYRRRYNISMEKYHQTTYRLLEVGALHSPSYVKAEWHLPVLVCLFRHYPKWSGEFRHIHPYCKTSAAEFLWKVAQLVVKGDFESATQLRRPFSGLGTKQFNLFSYISKLAKGDARYLTLLNEQEVEEMAGESLGEQFAEDELDENALQFFSKAISNTHPLHDYFNDQMAAYRFFITGKLEGFCGHDTMWSLIVDGIRLTYQGQLEEAFSRFKDAMSMVPGREPAFPSPIVNYVYGILLWRLQQKFPAESIWQQNLRRFRECRRIRYSEESICVRLLLEYIDQSPTTAQKHAGERMQLVLNHNNNPINRSWAFLIRNFFEIQAGTLEEPLHTAAILQHEMSAFLPIGPSAKQQLRETFGGNPLISTIRKKALWEMMLIDVARRVATEKGSGDRRVAWYVIGSDLQAATEQVMREDGTWRDGQLLSLSQMVSKGYECMNATDMAVANQLYQLKNYPNGKYDIDILVPLLKETGRLFYGDHLQKNPVPVVIEEILPYLDFHGHGAVIEVTSNVKMDDKGHLPHRVVRMEAHGHYSLITVNALQRDVMARFLQMGRFPASASVSLRKAIEGLHGIVDIRENILSLDLQPTTISKGLLAVRVRPVKNEYDVQVTATAMDNGIIRLVPAEGEDIVYDEADALTCCVRRDMAKENENYELLHDFILSSCKPEWKDYAHCVLWESASLLQLLAYIHDNPDRYFVEWPEGVRLKFKGEVKGTDVDVVVKSDEDWFKVEGEVKVGKEKMPIDQLIKLCCAQDKEGIDGFIRLGEDEYVRISEKLRRHIAALESFGKRGGRRLVPKYQVGALATMLNGLHAETDEGFVQFMEQTKTAFALEAPIPEGVKAKLRDYQKEGFRWMCRLDTWGAGGCLADDMGLGKTLQTLCFLLHKAPSGPSLVVAPKSVVPNWVSEAARFTPSLQVNVLNNANSRYWAVENAGPGDVLVCTYGLLATEPDNLKHKQWNVVCLDEAHQIKNRQTIASHTAMELKASSRFILTGTPLQNNLSELWNLFQFINPGLLGNWSVFRDSYILPTLDEEHRMLLKETTMPFILRRTKEDVLTELPEKLVNTHLVEMTEHETAVYEDMREKVELKFKKNKSKKEREEAAQLKINFFSELTRLRLASCSMKLIHEGWAEPPSKVTALLDLLDLLMEEPSNHILVFSQFTSFLDSIKPELKNRCYDFLYLDGQTPLDKRQELVKSFQNGDCRLFLSSLKAGGLGINLTQANYVILLDPWWNPAIENQAMDRAHRLGQKRVVSVIRLISQHTIEEKILRLHETKQILSDDILDGTADSYKLTYEDVMDMVAPF